jgi:GTPase SAR1 family protein
MQEEESQREVKIVIIGDSNVGKTSGFAPLINYSTSLIKYWDTILGLMLRYVDNTFSPQAVNINVDFKEKIFNHSSGAQLSCKLWDTAGQERYRTMLV